MRILGVTVGRNEADRYLSQVVDWTHKFVDRHLYFDDGSIDTSLDIAVAGGCTGMGSDGNRFLDDESEVREEAWQWVDKLLDPKPGDWVISIDSDEFLVASNDGGTEREVLERAIEEAEATGHSSLVFNVREVFGWDDNDRPQYRVDMFWGQITAHRAMRWTGNTEFDRVELGGGSLPAGVDNPMRVKGLDILHFGYASAEDREMKAKRYAARPGVHNPAHLDSILRPPMLETWRGRVPWGS